MTDTNTQPAASERMMAERLAEIAGWLLDDPDFYINCTEREATDAIRDFLADRQSLERELANTKAGHSATLHGMQDGAIVRDLQGQVERLERERSTLSARAEAAEARAERARADALLEAADMCSRFDDCGPSFIAQRLRDTATRITAPPPTAGAR